MTGESLMKCAERNADFQNETFCGILFPTVLIRQQVTMRITARRRHQGPAGSIDLQICAILLMHRVGRKLTCCGSRVHFSFPLFVSCRTFPDTHSYHVSIDHMLTHSLRMPCECGCSSLGIMLG